MKYCKKCVMPDTKPGVVLDEDGICQACRHYENRDMIDWDARWNELEKLCDKYRKKDGYWDCIIAVSGGKDSYFQIHTLKNKLNMNPLLVTANTTFSITETGKHNFFNMCDAFGCDNITLNLNLDVARRMTKISFEEEGFAAMPMDLAIYVFPIRIAINYRIPLVFYGENVSYEYGGVQEKENYSALDQIYNTVATPIDLKYWEKRGVTRKEINPLIYPTKEEIDKSKMEPAYLSYFTPWDGYKNYQIAKKYGFKDISHEWKREGYIEDYDQIDTIGYLMNPWLKYPKYGFARATDVSCYWIRSGKITREEGIKYVKEYDHKLDQIVLEDWLNYTGHTSKEFWDIVEKFWNRDIFEKVDDQWKLKNPIWEQLPEIEKSLLQR
jgi:N-acetyl sugar amidotransferase